MMWSENEHFFHALEKFWKYICKDAQTSGHVWDCPRNNFKTPDFIVHTCNLPKRFSYSSGQKLDEFPDIILGCRLKCKVEHEIMVDVHFPPSQITRPYTTQLSMENPCALLLSDSAYLPLAGMFFSTCQVKAKCDNDNQYVELISINMFDKELRKRLVNDGFDILVPSNGTVITSRSGMFQESSVSFLGRQLPGNFICGSIQINRVLPQLYAKPHPIIQKCFKDLMEVAWHPKRYIAWCIDEEERSEYNALKNSLNSP